MPASDHNEHLVAGDANLVLDVTNELAAVDVEERSGVCERVPATFLAQPDHGRTQAMHGRTAGAELGEAMHAMTKFDIAALQKTHVGK